MPFDTVDPERRAVAIQRAMQAIAQARALRQAPTAPFIMRDRRGRPSRVTIGDSIAVYLVYARHWRRQAEIAR